ncbi:MAG TPA: hypothetical protein VJ301_10495 [Propionibacteriaceae bacterium]|nr:hypothetical protein [Propionibacteriaceae bacterium]
MASTQGQQHDESPLSWPGDRNILTILDNLQWSEASEVHAPTLPPPSRGQAYVERRQEAAAF